MSKRGLPTSVQMRHDAHYVDSIATSARSIGKTIPVNLIAPNPEQPRREIGDLSELSDSIREKGVLEPLLVKPDHRTGTYMIIAGERRWRASQLAGLTEVPCIELDLDEKGVAEIALIENLQRKDLTIWEEADGLAALKEKFGYTQDEIARKISKSRPTVTELLTIAGLPKSIRQKCSQAKIASKSTLLEIARQFDEEQMFAYINRSQFGRKPSSIKAEASPTTKPSNSVSKLDGSLFHFTGENFSMDISFQTDSDAKPRDVIRAVKTVLEDLKRLSKAASG